MKIVIEVSLKNDFINFLKEENCYEEFCRNLDEDVRGIALRWERPNYWVSGAFRWSSTPEGVEYWSTLSQKWEKRISVFNKAVAKGIPADSVCFRSIDVPDPGKGGTDEDWEELFPSMNLCGKWYTVQRKISNFYGRKFLILSKGPEKSGNDWMIKVWLPECDESTMIHYDGLNFVSDN